MKNKILALLILMIFSSCATIKNNSAISKNFRIKPETETIAVPAKKEKHNAALDEDVGAIEINTKTATPRNIKSSRTQGNQNKTTVAQNKNIQTQPENNSGDMKIRELDLKEATVSENKTIHVSISDPGWMLKSIKPDDIIKEIDRSDLDNNTLFQLRTVYPGKAELVFLKYDYARKMIFRQPYIINIKASDFQENNSNSNEKNLTKEDRNENLKQAIDFFNDRNYQRSEDIFSSLLPDPKNEDLIYYYLGMIEKNKKNFEQAAENFKKAIAFKNSDYYIKSVMELINAYKELKDYDDALNLYYSLNLSKIDDPNLQALNLTLADIYFYMKKFTRAKDEYKKFIDKYPDSELYVKALFYYAYSLENLGTNPDFKEAYKIYQQITTDYPASTYYELSKNRIMFLDRHYFKIK